MEIQDGREINLRAADIELSDVRGPLRMPKFRRELAVQDVLGSLAYLTAERVIPFATTYRTLQPEGAHQFQHGLLRYPPSLPSQDSEDTTVSVCAVRSFEGFTDGLFERSMPVRVTESISMVVEGRSREVRDRQQKRKRKLGLEVFDGSNFQRRSCDLKARNFPRYATSARSRSFSLRNFSSSLSSGMLPRSLGGRPRLFGRNPSSPSRR